MPPEELVGCVDFRYISDALTPDDALEILGRNAPTRGPREAEMIRDGYPAYTTSAGWLGCTDAQVRQLCREAIANGWNHLKMKVGANLDQDLHRAQLIRDQIGWERKLM